ncbi:MAG: sigma 54-interacting transcriptional regulator [Myxococcota bacterium]|nr:sigma 54-interacting transcriptional regulator [Myxococcota bacterium]
MPFLKAPDGETHELYRPLSVVGTGAGCDLQLPAVDGIAAGHFQLLAEAGTHRLLARASTRVNGAKIKETLLGDGDRIEIGPLQLTYHMEQPKEAEPHQPVDHRDLERLLEFARSIQTGASPTMLLDTLLEHCVALAEADSGYIVLLEADGGAKVAARSGQAQTTAEPVLLSDTLLKEVQGRRHPLLIADVMDHTLFAQAQSVIDLRLKAAIGLPFWVDGTLRGLIHLGCSRPVHRFETDTLKVLEVFSAQAGILVALAERLETLEAEQAVLRARLEAVRSGRMIGSSPAMEKVFDRIERLARADAPVLILGETGTGKELVAQELHERSARKGKPFVALNCGAIPGELLESELFGHKKGAFTGAVRDRKGRLLEANGGTVLLDEIGEMPLPLQVKLLRVLQECQLTPVGGDRALPIDVRFLAATHVDLEAAIADASFREDLYYRLRVVDVELPPLRARGDDVLVLARAFLMEEDAPWTLAPEAAAALLQHDWPGNVRELRNRLRRACLMSDPTDRILTAQDLGLAELPSSQHSLADAVEEFKTRLIRETVARAGGNRTEAAKRLDIDPRTIYRHLNRLNTRQSS